MGQGRRPGEGGLMAEQQRLAPAARASGRLAAVCCGAEPAWYWPGSLPWLLGRAFRRVALRAARDAGDEDGRLDAGGPERAPGLCRGAFDHLGRARLRLHHHRGRSAADGEAGSRVAAACHLARIPGTHGPRARSAGGPGQPVRLTANSLTVDIVPIVVRGRSTADGAERV